MKAYCRWNLSRILILISLFFYVLPVVYIIIFSVCWCQKLNESKSRSQIVSRLNTNQKVADINSIANNLKYEPYERAKAIATIFANHVKTGHGAKDLEKIFGYNQWIGGVDVSKVEDTDIKVLKESKDDEVFRIALSPDTEKWSPWCIYISFAQKHNLDKFDVLLFLSGHIEKDNDIRILRFAIGYPDGWIEIFSDKGMISANYSEKTLLVMELLMKEIISQEKRTELWFIDFESDNKTIKEFLGRFATFSNLSVKAKLDAKKDEDGFVWDKLTGKQGSLVRARVFRWLSQDRAEVECGGYTHSLDANGTSGIIKLNGKVINWEKYFSNWET